MTSDIASMIIRGRVIEDDLVEFGGRGDGVKFRAPDPHKYADQLPLASPALLGDLYKISFEDILDYLDELGGRLDINTNLHLQHARELTYATAPTTKPLVDGFYALLSRLFRKERVRQITENTLGVRYLEGWVPVDKDGQIEGYVRAFGCRTLHVVAGNAPSVSAETIIRNAITRSDCLIKAPSNDPFTAIAIAKTMCEMAPDHPITRHVAVAYWRGGDEKLEARLYQPHNIEKVVAWGGFASVKHVTKYIQPGLELISCDPKYSISVVGADALVDEAAMRETALRLAVDIGGLNQVGCVNSRVTYVLNDGTPEGLAKVNELGRLTYEEMVGLPETISTKPKTYDRELKSHVDAARLNDDWFNVIGGEGEGGIIVSQLPEPVDFATYLNDRTANLVPVTSLDEVIPRIDSYTKTIGVWPEALKDELLVGAALQGAQCIVTLGHALRHTPWLPHDAMELNRRLCKWISNEVAPPVSNLAFAGARRDGIQAIHPERGHDLTVQAFNMAPHPGE